MVASAWRLRRLLEARLAKSKSSSAEEAPLAASMAASAAAISARAASASSFAALTASLRLPSDWVVEGPADPVDPVNPSNVDPVGMDPSNVDPVGMDPSKVDPVGIDPSKVDPVVSIETGDIVDPVPVDPVPGNSVDPVNPSSHWTSALSATGLEMKQYSRPSLS